MQTTRVWLGTVLLLLGCRSEVGIIANVLQASVPVRGGASALADIEVELELWGHERGFPSGHAQVAVLERVYLGRQEGHAVAPQLDLMLQFPDGVQPVVREGDSDRYRLENIGTKNG